MVCLVCCVVGLMVSPVIALGASSPSAEGSGAASSLSGSLVVPGSLTAGGEARAAEEAKRDGPEAVAAREASRTKYAGLGAEAQANVASEVDPRVIDSPGGGPPLLPAGQSITTFSADNIATLSLPEGQRGVLESLAPMAVETSSGQRVPIDLALNDVGGAFEPSRPWEGVSLRIPKRLADGVSLASGGVSLTPVDEHGVALGGSEGSVVGSTVFYGSTETDTAVAVKPTTFGFDLQTLLYSVSSPQTLYFRVGLAEGVALRQTGTPGGGVQVMDAGQVIGTVAAPSAVDAEGTPVPVSMSITGDTLTLTVDHAEGSYLYPIVADPAMTVSDKYLDLPGNWAFGTDDPEGFVGYEEPEVGGFPQVVGVKSKSGGSGKYEAGQYGVVQYPTQHESRVYEFFAHSEQFNNLAEDTDTTLAIANNKKEIENTGGKAVVLPNSGASETILCVESGCGTGSVAEHHENYAQLEEHVLVTGEDGGFAGQLTTASPTTFVAVAQEKGPSVSVDTTDKTFGSAPNGAYPGQWVNGSGKIGTVPTDPGIGISAASYSSPQASGWGHGFQAVPECHGVQCDECWNLSSRCEAGHSTSNEPLSSTLSGLPDGEDTVEVKVENATGETATTTGKVLMDSTPPHSITLSGLGSGNQIGEYEHSRVKVEATDGSGSNPSSGVKSIAVAIDGREIGKPQGSCPKGPCTASGEWEINGAELGVGAHRLKAIATDNVGNVATEEFTVTVHHATPVSLGPGSVGPLSGEFSLSATDVSVSAPGSSLTVSRSYGSRHLTAGSEGPLGPQWSLSVGGQESITKLATGSVTLTAATGGQTMFTSKEGGGFNSPPGDASLALSETKNGKGELTEYVLKDAADAATTRFTSLSGPSASLWKPTKQEGPLASQTVRYIYQTVEGVTAPKWAIAPEPAGLSFSCVSKAEKSEKLEKGCRALYFKYAEKTKESIGENEKEWGEYKGRLKQVLFEAYNPAKGIEKMEEKPVAEYLYDKQGRLRAEWNPQIEHPLKAIYGYDAEGHVTALTPPGQETWAFTYGTIVGDSNTGRLLKVTQAPASSALWGGEPPKNTEAEPPKVTGTPFTGVRMAVSSGTWSNFPVAYGYQWEDCNTEGKECTPILGATNANYSPAESDIGHTLVAEVIATNGGGSMIATSAATHTVTATELTEYAVSGKEPYGITKGPDGNLWFADYASKKLGKITTGGVVTEYSSVGLPQSITEGSDKNLWFTELLPGKIGKITTSGTVTEYSVPSESVPWGITSGPDKNLWFTDDGTSKIGKITTSGTITEYSLPEKSAPRGITVGPDENLWFTDYGTGKIGKITTSGTVTEYSLPSGSVPYGITSGPDKNLWFTNDGTNKIGKITTSGTVTEYSLPSGSVPYGITSGPDKNLWFTDYGTGKIGKITTSGTITEYAQPANSKPYGIVSGPDENLWSTDKGTNKITKLNPSPTIVEGEQHTPGPGWTVEYHIPLSGTGLPTLTSEEVEKWGQKDDSTEGMAIFPPDEPQGWPASDYKHASVTYLDEVGRAVNTVSPSGAISTAEYNGTNDVVRGLSADNRLAALKEGCESKEKCKSAEVSKLLDTESTYEEKGSEPGTEVLSTLGPQHTVKLTSGTQVEARSHTVYSYNEGAPSEGGPYHLVTKTTEGAQYSGKEEDVHTTTTSYSGQENLGWKLRKPTSVTTNPSGMKLTHTTAYEASTGNVKETTMPAATPELTEYAVSGKEPYGITKGPDGNLWFADYASKKLGKITTGGVVTEYSSVGLPQSITEGSDKNLWFTELLPGKIGKITTSGTVTEYSVPSESVPWGITSGPDKNLWFTDDGTSKIGKITTSGTITEYSLPEKSAPRGITVGPDENLWFTDYGTGKIGKITTSGTVTEYSLPSGSVPYGITSGPDKNLWFTNDGTGKIGKITTSGTVTEYSLPSGSVPYGITSGPDKNLWFTDYGTGKIGKITTSGTITEYAQPANSKPYGIVSGPDENLWSTDKGTNKITKLKPGSAVGNAGAYNTQTIYYTTAANEKYKECGEHPEWANLPCETQPAEQPETSGLPNLPITKYNTYNMFDEPEKGTETVGPATRTTTMTYDAAGRPLTSEQASTEGKALPKVTDKYSETTGQLVEHSTTSGSETKTLASKYNTLGQLTSYTDADENTTTYEYEGEGSYKGAKELDGRLRHVSDGKGTQVYTYEETTGALKELVDTQGTHVLTFTGSYDIEGNMTSEGYPNGMTAAYTRNTASETTGIEYVKNTHCATKCPETWFDDSVTPSIHGQALEQVSSLSKESYTYDEAGRLTQVQETPTGEGCTTRAYTYEADTNRTNLTTAKPNSKGECTTEGATEEKHSYDTADRLTDTGIKYNEFGDITKLPTADAGGHELTSSFYVDGQLEGQTQNGQSNTYQLDPEHRTRETIAGTTATITHYAGPGDTPSWTAEPVSGHWSRYVSGIGGFAAIETSTTEPELQLTDLQGNVVAKASASETATKLLSTERSTEYGVPTTTKPAKYGWLGSDLNATELPSGVVAMGARSYVPQIGRFLQTDPVPGGSANAYAYTYGDPVNTSDPSGEYTAEFDSAGGEVAAGVGAELVAERKATEEAAARAAAEKEAEEAAFWTHLMEPKGSELPEPPEAVPGASEPEVIGESEQPSSGSEGGGGCSGDNACAAATGSEWVCTISGNIVAAGVGVATAGVTGILAGFAFTEGCNMGAGNDPAYLSGLPRRPSDCFNVFTFSKRTHQYDHKIQECYA